MGNDLAGGCEEEEEEEDDGAELPEVDLKLGSDSSSQEELKDVLSPGSRKHQELRGEWPRRARVGLWSCIDVHLVALLRAALGGTQNTR